MPRDSCPNCDGTKDTRSKQCSSCRGAKAAQKVYTCPSCEGPKDHRATMCQPCRFKYNHPREKGPDHWYNTAKGYKYKSINGVKIYQHRYVMEQHLGRKLTSKEVVHHINHDKSDNRIENLELVANHSEHMKQHSDSETMKERSIKGHRARWNYIENGG